MPKKKNNNYKLNLETPAVRLKANIISYLENSRLAKTNPMIAAREGELKAKGRLRQQLKFPYRLYLERCYSFFTDILRLLGLKYPFSSSFDHEVLRKKPSCCVVTTTLPGIVFWSSTVAFFPTKKLQEQSTSTAERDVKRLKTAKLFIISQGKGTFGVSAGTMSKKFLKHKAAWLEDIYTWLISDDFQFNEMHRKFATFNSGLE